MRTVRQRDGLPFAHAQRTWGDDVLCIRRIKADDGFRCEGDSSTLSGGQQWRNVHGRYLATYKKNGVTVNVQSEGLSRDEFCALVENLLAE